MDPMKIRQLAFAAVTLIAGAAQAQVQVDAPWVRSTVAQQKTTAAYMGLSVGL